MHTLIPELPILLLCSYPLILSISIWQSGKFHSPTFYLPWTPSWVFFKMIKFLLFPSKCSHPFFQHMISFTQKTVSTSEVLLTNALSLVICLVILLFFLPIVAKFTKSNKSNTLNHHVLFFLQSFDTSRCYFHTFQLPPIYLQVYCPYFSAKFMYLLWRSSFNSSFDIFIPLFSPVFAVSKSCK